MSHYCRWLRSGMRDDFSGVNLLKREFTGAGGDDANALTRLKSGVFEPMAAQADFRFDLV